MLILEDGKMKFLDTNLTVEDFISSLRKAKDNLPGLLNEWDSIDYDLQAEYIDQLQWAFEKAAEFIEKHSTMSFYCNGCGEPKHKCYCDNICPTCGRKEYDCSSDSPDGECPNKINTNKRIKFTKEQVEAAFNKGLESGNKVVIK